MGEMSCNAYAEKRDLNELVGKLRIKAQQEGEGTKLGDGRKRRVTLAWLRTYRRDKSTLPIPIELAIYRVHLPSRSFFAAFGMILDMRSRARSARPALLHLSVDCADTSYEGKKRWPLLPMVATHMAPSSL